MEQALIELAKTYLIDLVVKNEAVQQFPKDFLTEGMKWVRSWFLKDDPVTTAVVESAKPAAVKEAVLNDKLMELLKNPKFVEELRAQLAAYEAHRPRQKNTLEGGSVNAGNVHIGDTGTSADGTVYDQKNTVKNTIITATGNFRLGDDKNPRAEEAC